MSQISESVWNDKNPSAKTWQITRQLSHSWKGKDNSKVQSNDYKKCQSVYMFKQNVVIGALRQAESGSWSVFFNVVSWDHALNVNIR